MGGGLAVLPVGAFRPEDSPPLGSRMPETPRRGMKTHGRSPFSRFPYRVLTGWEPVTALRLFPSSMGTCRPPESVFGAGVSIHRRISRHCASAAFYPQLSSLTFCSRPTDSCSPFLPVLSSWMFSWAQSPGPDKLRKVGARVMKSGDNCPGPQPAPGCLCLSALKLSLIHIQADGSERLKRKPKFERGKE